MTNRIHQIYIGDNFNLVSESYGKEMESLKNINNSEYTLWTKDSIEKLISDNFEKVVLEAYHKIRPLAYKADLARYCILYVHGGLYSDLGNLVYEKDIFHIFKYNDFVLFKETELHPIYSYPNLQNSMMYFKNKKSNFLLSAINSITNDSLSEKYNDTPWDVTGPTMLYRIMDDLEESSIGDFVHSEKDGSSSFIFNNICIAKFKDRRDPSKNIFIDENHYYRQWELRNIYN